MKIRKVLTTIVLWLVVPIVSVILPAEHHAYTLFSNDGPLGWQMSLHTQTGGFFGIDWNDLNWLGIPGPVNSVSLGSTVLLLCELPLVFLIVKHGFLLAVFYGVASFYWEADKEGKRLTEFVFGSWLVLLFLINYG